MAGGCCVGKPTSMEKTTHADPFILALPMNRYLLEGLPLAPYEGDMTEPEEDLSRDVTGDCPPHAPILLYLKPCVETSLRAPFEELTYFLPISNGTIQNSRISIFTLAAGQSRENSQTNENRGIGSPERLPRFP